MPATGRDVERHRVALLVGARVAARGRREARFGLHRFARKRPRERVRRARIFGAVAEADVLADTPAGARARQVPADRVLELGRRVFDYAFLFGRAGEVAFGVDRDRGDFEVIIDALARYAAHHRGADHDVLHRAFVRRDIERHRVALRVGARIAPRLYRWYHFFFFFFFSGFAFGFFLGFTFGFFFAFGFFFGFASRFFFGFPFGFFFGFPFGLFFGFPFGLFFGFPFGLFFSSGFYRTRFITTIDGACAPRARDTGNRNNKTASRKPGDCHKPFDMRVPKRGMALTVQVNSHPRPRPVWSAVELHRQFAASDAHLVRRQDDQGRRGRGTLGRLTVRWDRRGRPRGGPQCERACGQRGEDHQEARRQRAQSDDVR